MKNIRLKKLVLSLCFSTLLLQACAGTRHSMNQTDDSIQAPVIVDKPVEVGAVVPGGGEVYGPPLPGGENRAATVAAPVSTAPKLCVALGPGMAKALAEVSVLDALVRAGLPIHCVVGSEMGAVIGALFARANGSANPLAWELFKLNKSSYFNFPVFAIREAKSSGTKLHEVFDGIFRGGKIESLPLQFSAVATDSASGAVNNLNHGSVSDALSASVALPGIFDPWQVEGQDLVSGAISSPLALDAAAALGADFIIAVSVMDDVGSTAPGAERFQHAFAPVRNLLRMQRRDVKEFIQIHLPNIAYDDFSKQAEIFAIGKDVAEKEALRIKADWDAAVAHAANAPTNTEHP